VTAFVGLLRGVNVGGRNRIAMADLREVAESLGHRDVATFIQSGNVVFSADHGSEPADEDRLGESIRVAIAARLDLEVDVMVRGRAALDRIVGAVPFPDADPKQLLVAFLATTPSPDARQALAAVEAAPEEARVIGREAYLHLPNGVGRSVLSPLLERRLRVSATARNLNTVRTLLAMLEAIEG
jgi:uncharacterized protein (DUF1697 family)